MQAASDVVLIWFARRASTGVERDFYIRQLWDGKGSALVEPMEPDALIANAEARSRRLSGQQVGVGIADRRSRGVTPCGRGCCFGKPSRQHVGEPPGLLELMLLRLVGDLYAEIALFGSAGSPAGTGFEHLVNPATA